MTPIFRPADQVLAVKKKDPDADTLALERRIDQMVYKLCDLTPDETDITENFNRK